MKIDITKREYLTLLEIQEIAGWVLHAHKIGEDPRTKKYRKLEQKIFSYAKDAGYENLIVYDEDRGEYFPTREFEEASPGMEFVEEFEDDSFWEELIQRLVERDLVRQEGEEKVLRMGLEERFKKQEVLERKYSKEFETNGLGRITIPSKASG